MDNYKYNKYISIKTDYLNLTNNTLLGGGTSSDSERVDLNRKQEMVEFIYNLLKRYGKYTQDMIDNLVIYDDEEQTIKNLKVEQLKYGLTENLYSDESNKMRAGSKIKFIKRNIKHHKKIRSFLDFGGGSCDIAYYVGQFLNLEKENTYCIDIDEWIGFKWERNKNITYMKTMDNLPDNSIDLIMASYVLHHIEDSEIKAIIKNFYRILSKHGSIILVEHDSPDTHFDNLLDIQHMLYDTVISQAVEYSKFKDTYYSNYKPVKEWNKLFGKFRKKRIITTKKYDNTFYGIYKK